MFFFGIICFLGKTHRDLNPNGVSIWAAQRGCAAERGFHPANPRGREPCGDSWPCPGSFHPHSALGAGWRHGISFSAESQFLTQKITKQSDSHVQKQSFYYVAPQIKIIIFSQNSLLVLFTPVPLVFFFPWKFYPNKYSYKTFRRLFQTSASQNRYFDK